MWIDSHCHLNDPAYAADYREVIGRAVSEGVTTLVVVGYDLPSSERAVELAGEFDCVWAAVGVSPHDAKDWNERAAGCLEQLLQTPRVVALGEIGLDYHYQESSREQQWLAFEAQLAIAASHGKPVIIHTREAAQDTLDRLANAKSGAGVMHCYTGSLEMAREFMKLGFYISFAGPLTFSNAARLREVAAGVPLERTLIETDCPYLTPHPFRGKRNEPANLVLTGQKLAEIKGIPVDQAMAQTSANTRSLFGIQGS